MILLLTELEIIGQYVERAPERRYFGLHPTGQQDLRQTELARISKRVTNL